MTDNGIMEQVLQIADEAGREILDIYEKDYDVIEKADGSPVTVADHRAHELISRRLEPLIPLTPVLSEESSGITAAERMDWQRFWLVDPLDGTKEFIKRNGEFTVNIALIEAGLPVLGVVHTPVREMSHFATVGQGAWRRTEGGNNERIESSHYNGGAARMVVSRSHSGSAVDRFREALAECSGHGVESISMGSALKVCLVAEGSADVYPRLGPTSEWDTGASHCILNESGGRIMDCAGNNLQYNKPSVLNPWFIAVGDPRYDWISVCPDLSG
ncbi:MAG: 3'(2'),5'-bisphosphate nucleotidase CysQ [Pseudomonadota bacterium]|nr:3'(2'),5'-bisphosphate nucleotidase CysQ [Pseudomonadota bacterium]